MHVFRKGLILWFLIEPYLLSGQSTGFDSFISRISEQYKVDVAIAPELIPVLDSLRGVGIEIKTVDELLRRLFHHSGLTYQIIDGNKVMLRREDPYTPISQLTVIRGIIKDGQSGEPLPYATIRVHEDNSFCHTDDDGQFILPVRAITGLVQINYLGYKSVSLPVSDFLSGNTMVYMENQKIPLEEVMVVVPYRLMAQDYSSQSVDLRGYQYISEDQLLTWNAERLISSLTTYTHFSSDHGIRIRGSEVLNSLILMDEIPVYNPYHFYNIFSPFNGNYFSSVKVFKNNLPIEYGGRIDGLIHVQSERDIPKSKLILDTDLLQSSINTELVLSPKIHLIAGGRVSYTGILNEALSDTSVSNFSWPGGFKDENEYSTSQQPISDFYDINLGLSIQTGAKGKVSLHYFNSRDELDNTTNTNFETSLFNHEIISVQQTYKSEDIWKNKGVSAGYSTRIGYNSVFEIQGFHSEYNNDVRYASHTKELRFGNLRTSHFWGMLESNLSSNGLKSFIRRNVNDYLGYAAGIEFQAHHSDFLARENNSLFLGQGQMEKEASVFGEFRHTLAKKLEWSIGSRFTYLRSTSKMYLLPNLSAIYQVNEKFSLRASFSKNLQSVRKLTVEDRFGRELDYLVLSEPDQKYPVMKSDKYMIGAGYSSTYLSIDAEWYYKKSVGLARVRPLRPNPAHDDGGAPPENFYQLFAGEGWTSGIDFTILYKRKNFEMSLLYTLSKIEERYDRLFNGDPFSPQEDRRHQIKVASTWLVGKFQLSSLITYKSKAPYLSLVRLEGRDGIGMVEQRAVERFLPSYFSLDLGLDYSFRLFNQPAMIGVSLINATNHQNINDLQHIGRISRDGGKGLYITSQTELLGRTANVHFRYMIK